MSETFDFDEMMEFITNEAPELANVPLKIDIYSPKISRNDAIEKPKMVSRKNYTKKCSMSFTFNDLTDIMDKITASTPITDIPNAKKTKSCDIYEKASNKNTMVGDVYCLSMKLGDEGFNQCFKIKYGIEELGKF